MPQQNVKGTQQNKGPKEGKPAYLGEGLLGKTPGALKPYTSEEILDQALALSKAVYKPALASLNQQKSAADALYEKRKADAAYYNQWLFERSNQLAANAAAADQQLLTAQSGVQQASLTALKGLQDSLGMPNSGQDPNARNIGLQNVLGAQAVGSQGLIQGAQEASWQQASSQQESYRSQQASNLAAATANEARNSAQHYEALKTIADAKQTVKLERAARAQEEVARMLEQEVAKAESRVEMRNSAAQLALAMKSHRLQKKQQKIDARQARADLAITEAQLAETQRHNQATEGIAQQNADTNTQEAANDARGDREGEGGGRENNQERAHDAKQAQAAARAIGQEFGYEKLKKNFSGFVNKIADEADVPYAVAARMARRWLRAHRPGGGPGDPVNPADFDKRG